ncbi:hypothetical protein ES703_08494 [subsurface metagenome]
MANKKKNPEETDVRIENPLNYFAMMYEAQQKGALGVVPDSVKVVLKETTSWLGSIETGIWATMFNTFVDAGLLTGEQAKDMMKLKDTCTPLDIIFFVMTTLKLIYTYFDTQTSIGSNFLAQGINKKYRSNLPDPREIMPAAFIAPEKTGEVREVCKRMGFKDADIDLLFLAMYRLYDEGNVRVLWLRGVLSDDEMFMRMRELGYTDTRIKEVIQGWTIIPGPTDLFHLVAKEAFEPDMIERMGYADEFPVEQVEWLKKQGISEEWAKKYWYAHWETPSIGQGFEMLHREDPERPGQSIINEEELDMLYRTVEIPPYWRSRLSKIAYAPYTRVDVRRMHDMGVLTDKELIQSYKDLGYDQVHAEKMADFTIRYNRQGDKELTKSQILKGYSEKIFSKEDAKQFLLDIEYPDALADYLILMEDYKEAKDLQDDILSNIKTRYQNNMADEFETRSKLGQLNLTGERIAVLMDKWKIKKWIDIKVPSKSDLDKFLAGKIINLDTYRIEMDRLGYNTKYIGWYEQLTALKGGK